MEPATKMLEFKQDGNIDKRRKVVSYSLNTMLYLPLMMNGCGAKEHHNITSMLGLPSPKSTTKRYNQMMHSLYDKIIDAGTFSVELALNEEIQAQYKYDNANSNISTWQLFILTNANYIIGLKVSYDMAWNKRSSGRRYDTLSGHGLFFDSKSNWCGNEIQTVLHMCFL